MKKTIGFIAILVLLSAFCVQSQNNLSITGKINSTDYSLVYLDDLITAEHIDSSVVDAKGAFSFNIKIQTATLVNLFFNQSNYVILITEPGEKIELSFQKDSLLSPVVKGSPNTLLVYKILNQLSTYEKEVEKAKQISDAKQKVYLNDVLTKNFSSLACLFFVNKLDMEKDNKTIKKIATELNAKHADNKLVADLYTKYTSANKLAIGSEAPEIELPDTMGINLKLSSLRGKYVLVDFWASWCAPCRRENPNLVKLYEKYKSKGFEIYGVSLDRDKNSWTDAIQKDNMTWKHVSDLKFWETSVVASYGFEGIPYSVLLDKEGKIVAKGLRGDELEKKVGELIK